MPHPHDHEAWKKKKEEQRARREDRRGKRKAADADGPDKKDNQQSDKSAKMKLALNQKLSTTLVTQHHLSQVEADDLFNSMYQEAEASLN